MTATIPASFTALRCNAANEPLRWLAFPLRFFPPLE